MSSPCMMRIWNGKEVTFFRCPSQVHLVAHKQPEEIKDYYYSYQHAVDDGWVFTTDSHWSKDGSDVGVCPDCAKKYNWSKERG